MKTVYFLLITVTIIAITQFITIPGSGENEKTEYVLVIHGGAGVIDKSIPDSIKNGYYESLSNALKIGEKILKNGGSSLNAVEQVVVYLEDDEKFNAGKGSVFTIEGKHELDASIMNGENLACGAVAGVTNVKNPVSLARMVMEKSPHVLLISEGAEKFADEMGIETVEQEYFFNKRRYEAWKRMQEEKKGTVGAVALDKQGNLAAATSTGGTTNKRKGRVGDVAIIGAGNYANNKTCAVSATGKGEEFIRHNIASTISALMEFGRLSLKDAANEVVFNRLKEGDGGIIAVDTKGNYTMPFNTPGMFRGVVTSNGIFETLIWED